MATMADHADIDDADGQLLSELRAFFARTDPAPPDAIAAAYAAIELRDIESQIADLLRDSVLEDKELAGVRGGGQRSLSFGAGDRFLEVDVTEVASERRLAGYVVPGAAGSIRFEGLEGDAMAPLDAHGRFKLEGLKRGPLRMTVDVPGLPPFRTPWLTI